MKNYLMVSFVTTIIVYLIVSFVLWDITWISLIGSWKVIDRVIFLVYFFFKEWLIIILSYSFNLKDFFK